MKLLKSIFIVMLFVSANAALAQSNTPQWREFSNVSEVINRIDRGNEQSNYEPLKGFAETLHNMAMQLTAKTIPAPYDSKSNLATIKKLQKLTATLHASALAKAPVSTLRAQFGDAQKAYQELATAVKLK